MTFEGQFYSLNEAEVRISPINGNEVPVYVAATGPKALGVAGEIGNGWVTNAMSTGVFSRKLAQVQKTRESVGKIGADFEKCIYIFVSWAEDKEAAYQILDRIKHAVIWPDVIEQTDYDLEID